MSIEDKIADLLKESEALQMAEACKTRQLDELSKATLGSYIKNAALDVKDQTRASVEKDNDRNSGWDFIHGKKAKKRLIGIDHAVDKLTKEDIDEDLDEALDIETTKVPVGERPKGPGWSLHRSGQQRNEPHDVFKRKTKKVLNTNVKEDVDALMNGENLTEEFREKATAIFEAAVMSRVTQEVETLEEEFQERLVEYYEGAKEEIVEKVDGYLNYVVEQWMNDNELAVTTGIKNDILEGFVSGMKNLFQEHYIEVPDEKLDLVAELQESVAKLESKLDESLESNVTMSKYINYVERNTITEEFCKLMTDTEVEKFKSLAEELSFEDSDTYSSKLQIIKENYFGKKSTAGTVASIVTDSPVQLTESVQNIDPNVAQYLETFNRIKI